MVPPSILEQNHKKKFWGGGDIQQEHLYLLFLLDGYFFRIGFRGGYFFSKVEKFGIKLHPFATFF